MSKFCNTCGQELDDSVVFCPNCGANNAPADSAPEAAPAEETVNPGFEAPAFDAPVADAAAEEAPQFSVDNIKSGLGDKLKPIIIAAVGVVAAIVVIVVLVNIFGASYKDPLDNMVAIYKGKYDKIEDMYPKEYWEYADEELDMTAEDVIENAEDSMDSLMEGLEEEYGENIKISYKVTDKKTLSDKKLKDIQDGLKDNYDIAKKDVTKAMELEVEMTIKGDDDEETDEEEMIVAKINGKWYAVSENGSLTGIF